MKPTWRKPVGTLMLLAYIAVWTVIVTSNWELIAPAPIWLQAIIYLFLGIVWIAPLRPLLLWTETGKWRE